MNPEEKLQKADTNALWDSWSQMSVSTEISCLNVHIPGLIPETVTQYIWLGAQEFAFSENRFMLIIKPVLYTMVHV